MSSFDWLEERASNLYSQFGEDGVLDAIFAVIRPANRWCLECGAADGLFMSNTRALLEQGWRGVMIEAEQSAFAALKETTASFGDKVIRVNARICRDVTLEGVLSACFAPPDIDLVVIDVDGQDYYLFNALLRYRPRVVVIEYDRNAEDDFTPTLGGTGQAGLNAIKKLAAAKYYTAVFQNPVNLVLVQQPLDRLLDGPREKFLRPEAAGESP